MRPSSSSVSISKTTFLYARQCKKRLWLYKNMRKERDLPDEKQQAVFQRGINIGIQAHRLFPGGVDASPEQPWQLDIWLQNTARLIAQGRKIIYEAAFLYDGIMCAIDILVQKNDRWFAFEVKASRGVREIHLTDIALQYFVITHAGIDLEDIFIISLHPDTPGELQEYEDSHFIETSLLAQVLPLQSSIETSCKEYLDVLQQPMPMISMGDQCQIPYPCDFQTFCAKWEGKI